MFQCRKASRAGPLDPRPDGSEMKKLSVRLFVLKFHVVGAPHYDGRSDTSPNEWNLLCNVVYQGTWDVSFAMLTTMGS